MGPIGRAGRLLLGSYWLLVAVPFYLFPGISFDFLGNTYGSSYVSISLAIVSTLGFLVFYLLYHVIASKYFPNLNRWIGAAVANIVPFAVFIFSAAMRLPIGEIASFTYVGIALVLAGLRKDGGCEVMAPANAILGKPAHFACIIFSPIDWAEGKSNRA